MGKFSDRVGRTGSRKEVSTRLASGGLWDGAFFHMLTRLVTDDVRQQREERIERLVAAIARSLPDEPLRAEQLQVARDALLGFVVRDAIGDELRTMPPDTYGQMPLIEQRSVYWIEIDRVARWARTRVLDLVQSRVLALANCDVDPVGSILHMRQMIELVIWAAFYQYGQTIAFNLLHKETEQLRDAFVICKELEDLVRGAVAPGNHRVADARAAVGLIGDIEVLEGQVAEIQTTITKQFAVVRFLASQVEEPRGEERLVTHVQRIHAAYRWACGFAHVTPQLLLCSDESQRSRLVDEAGFTVATATISSLVVLSRLVVRDDFAVVQFAPMFARRSSTVSGVVHYEVPDLVMLIAKNRKVVFRLSDGREILVYDPNSHG